jgi:hypothetical protein
MGELKSHQPWKEHKTNEEQIPAMQRKNNGCQRQKTGPKDKRYLVRRNMSPPT